LTPSEIAESYDLLADQWNSDSFPKTNGIQQHERAIAFLKDKRHALDAGCGSSGRFIDLFASHGFRSAGVDISTRMIELAQQRHPDVTFHHADIGQWQLPRKYDLISAWDSIWHLPLAEQAPVLSKLLHGLSVGGVCIFTMAGVDSATEKVDSYMGPKMYYSGIGIPATLELLTESGCACRHLEFDQYPELHLYVIAQRT
jgi:SAM-dependent methyltransferase